MQVQASDIVVGLIMALFGLVGLFLASRALDDEMCVFGLSLAGFASLFIFGQIHRHFDEITASRSGHDA
jgi:hypothetical protein